MEASNCFICAKEIDNDRTIIGNIPICLECISKANPENEFKEVKEIISKYNLSKTDKKK